MFRCAWRNELAEDTKAQNHTSTWNLENEGKEC